MNELICTLLAAISHELGHLLAMRIFGAQMKRLRLSAAGAVIESANLPRERVKRSVILLSGIAANLLGAAIGLALGTAAGELFAFCSLALAGVNLLPIRSLDGGEALRAIFGDSRLLRLISLATLVLVWFAAVAGVLASGNPSLYLLAAEVFISVYLRRAG